MPDPVLHLGHRAGTWLKTPPGAGQKTGAGKKLTTPEGEEPIADGPNVSWEIPDPNEILDALLARVETVLKETRAAANGMPLPAVEAELRARLQVVLPDARFTKQDIRAWSAGISS